MEQSPMKIIDAIRIVPKSNLLDIKDVVDGAVSLLHSDEAQDILIGGNQLEKFFENTIHNISQDNPLAKDNIIIALYREKEVEGITILITETPRSTKDNEEDFVYVEFDGEPAIGY